MEENWRTVKPEWILETIGFTLGLPSSFSDLLRCFMPTAPIFIPVTSAFLCICLYFQSSNHYPTHHFTKTSLVKVTEDLHVTKSKGHFAALILLDLCNKQLLCSITPHSCLLLGWQIDVLSGGLSPPPLNTSFSETVDEGVLFVTGQLLDTWPILNKSDTFPQNVNSKRSNKGLKTAAVALSCQ